MDTNTNTLQPHQARLNITWQGQTGDLPDPISFDAPNASIQQWATEAIRSGGVPGINVDPNVDFSDFVVDRFPSREDRPWNSIQLRPKVPFGG